MRSKPFLIYMLIVVLLSSCGYQQSNPSCEEFVSSMYDREGNKLLQITAPANVNDFKIEHPLFIVATNLSNYRIQTTPDNDLKLFVLQNNTWADIKNKVDYLGMSQLIPVRSDSDPGSQMYYAEFDTSNVNETLHVCIVLEGKIGANETTSEAFAFTQVTLNP